MSEEIQFSDRFAFGRIFKMDSIGAFSPLEVIEQLPGTETAENGLNSGFRPIYLEDRVKRKEDISEYLEAFAGKFTGCRYWFETRENRAVLSEDGSTVIEKTVEEIDYVDIFFEESGHIFVKGGLEACEKSESTLREITRDIKIREVVFDPDFLTWMFYKSRENTPLRREFSLQRIVDLEFFFQNHPRQMHGNDKNSGVENYVPALENILQGAEITRLNGEFEVAGYSVNSDIWRDEQVRIHSSGSLTESSNLRRLLISLRFIHELADLYSDWRSWAEDRKYPPTEFYYDIYEEIESQSAELDFSFDEVLVHRNSTIENPETIASESEAEILNAEIDTILEKGETETIEFKENLPPHRENIAKEAVALANKKGGVLVFGVDDDKNEPVGIPNYMEKEKIISNVISNSVDPDLNINIEFEEYNGKHLIVLRIGQYQTLPHSVDYTFYTRVGTTKRKLSPYQLSYLMPDRGK